MSQSYRRLPEIATCVWCGTKFERKNRKRKYCSDACKAQAYLDAHPEKQYQPKGRVSTVELQKNILSMQENITALFEVVKKNNEDIAQLREENKNLETRLRAVNWSEILLTSTGSSIGSALSNYLQKGQIAKAVRNDLTVVFQQMLNEIETYSLAQRNELQMFQSWVLGSLEVMFENQEQIGKSINKPIKPIQKVPLNEMIEKSRIHGTNLYNRLLNRLQVSQDLEKDPKGDKALRGRNLSTDGTRRIDDTHKTR